MGYQDDGFPGAHQAANDFEILETRSEIQAAGGFIQDQGLGVVDQHPAQQQSALLAGEKGRELSVMEMRHPQCFEDL